MANKKEKNKGSTVFYTNLNSKREKGEREESLESFHKDVYKFGSYSNFVCTA